MICPDYWLGRDTHLAARKWRNFLSSALQTVLEGYEKAKDGDSLITEWIVLKD